jgi:exopolyphosphatase/guanosine-5'-triphosphate,3'-diphosphate pyrophosphatase
LNYLDKNLQPLYEAVNKFPVTELVGSSGSFDSLAEMIAYKYYDIGLLKGITEYEFNIADCKKMYDIILRSTTNERLHMKGLTKMRVDMIVISVIFIDFIFEKLQLKKMRLSRYSLKEGVLWELLNKGQLVNSFHL